MNYIDSITLINFQSHVSTEMRSGGPGTVTGIVGPTGNGKTAILRALRWVCHNTPSGTDMIRADAKDCTVSIKMDDGTMVSRRRSRGGVNRYAVTNAAGETQGYESFGTGVPAEVQDAIGIKPLTIGDISMQLNFAGQLDGPFLGNDMPASARAKVLGKLSGMEEVDYAGRLLGTDLYRRRRDLDAATAEAEALTQRLGEYDYLDSLRQAIDALKVMIDQAEDTEFARDRFRRLREEDEAGLDRVRSIIDRMSALIWLQDLPDLEQVAGTLQQGRRLRQADLAYAAGKECLWRAREKTKALSWLDNFPELDRLAGEILRVGQAKRLREELLGINLAAEQAERVVGVTAFARDLSVDELIGIHNRKERLCNLWRGRLTTDAENERLIKMIEKAQAAQPDLTGLDAEKVIMLRHRAAFRNMMVGDVEMLKSRIREAKEQSAKTQTDLDELIRTTGRCPICHGELKKEDLI